MSLQAVPVHLAKTVNRWGSARAERRSPAGPAPAGPAPTGLGATGSGATLAVVTVGNRSFVARTHGHRVTRRGHQTLVSLRGRRVWVASSRVQSLTDGHATPA